MLKRTKLCTQLMAACGGFLLSAGGPAFAQSTQQLERVEITGSNIKRTDVETASPVQIITREEIDRSGKQSIQEVLRTVTADGQGSIPGSFSNGFASGSAAVSLRGLGVHSTLVLVNGRRMATYGLADDGSRTFVDLNTIPLEVVDRIEILKDGASAIYGSDAIGGVVNIILRKNYAGGMIGGTLGTSQEGDGETVRAYGTFGVGNLETDKYNAFVSIETSKQKNIWSKDRGFLGETNLTGKNFYDVTNGANRPYFGLGPSSSSPFGVTRTPPGTGTRVNVIPCDAPIPGADGVDPETGLCRYNSRVQQEIQPQVERFNLFGRGTLQISPTLQAFLEVGYFLTKNKANGTLGANNDGGVYNPADPANPIFHGLMTLPASHPDNTFGVDRTLAYAPFELGGRDQSTKNETIRLVQAFQGSNAGFDWEIGGAYIKNRLENVNKGFIRYDVMQAALNDGTYRINAPNTTDPAVLNAVSPDLRTTPTSSVKMIDAKMSHEIAKLDGGSMGIAVGGEIRWENQDSPPVPYTTAGEIVGLGYAAFSGSRRVEAIYGEITAPVTKWLELNGALRYDHYSDFGGTTNPKLGFKLTPINWLSVRGTYAEAFRAPGPAETGGSSFGFTSVGILSLGNPDLKPETAKSYTLGLIIEPVANVSATVDFWKITRKNEIVQADPATIIPAGTPTSADPGTKIAGAVPNSFIYYDSNGELSVVSGQYSNASKTLTQGVDIELRAKSRIGDAGTLSGAINYTYTDKFERTDALGNKLSYAGTHGPIVLSAGAGTPSDRASFSLTWDRGPFAITGVVNYVGSIKYKDHKGETVTDNGDGTVTDDVNGIFYNSNGATNCSAFTLDGEPYKGCKLPSFTTLDLFGRWSPAKNWDINVSIQNVFDTKAPFDAYLVNTYGINYNQTWHQSGAVGRFFTVGAKYTF